MRVLCLVVAVLLWGCAASAPVADPVSSPSAEAAASPLRDALMRAAGVDQWSRVERLSFTFHVQRPAGTVVRRWTWWPRSGEVTLVRPGPVGRALQTSYRRDDVEQATDPAVKEADRQFINDTVWLLPQVHLLWYPKAKIRDEGMAQLPVGGGLGRRIVIHFPPTGGYGPGDVYEWYVDDRYRILQWTLHRDGGGEPTLSCTWEGYYQVSPLWFATDHRNADGTFRLWFTDIQVTSSN